MVNERILKRCKELQLSIGKCDEIQEGYEDNMYALLTGKIHSVAFNCAEIDGSKLDCCNQPVMYPRRDVYWLSSDR